MEGLAYIDLSARYLSDSDLDALEEEFPGIPLSEWDGCPTCGGQRYYYWQGVRYECNCADQVDRHKHYCNANIGMLYQQLDWHDYHGDVKAHDMAQLYVTKHDKLIRQGIGLILYGEFGIGKTMLVSLIGKELIRLGHSVYFTTFPEMVHMFTASWRLEEDRRRFEDRIVKTEVLILDDLGKEFKTKTNLEESTFDFVLRKRVTALRPTIVTTNLDEFGFIQGYGAAAFSLLQERCWTYTLTGSDWRHNSRDRTQAELAKGWTREIV